MLGRSSRRRCPELQAPKLPSRSEREEIFSDLLRPAASELPSCLEIEKERVSDLLAMVLTTAWRRLDELLVEARLVGGKSLLQQLSPGGGGREIDRIRSG